MGRKKKQLEEVATMNNITGEIIQIRISADNLRNIEALCKYAQMLDIITNACDDEKLSIDGVINELLDEVSTKRIKEIAKKHGFTGEADVLETFEQCTDGEDVQAAIKEAEKTAYERVHSRILSHVPIEDRQRELFPRETA